MTWIRALAAAGLSIFLPGAGHALIRDWGRAIVFAGLFAAALVVFLPGEQLWTAVSAGSYAAVPDILETETTMLAQFTLSFLALFAAIDAGIQALGLAPGQGRGASRPGAADEPTCPNCGKTLDEDLDFCHWCTTRLEPEADETADP